MLYIGTAIPNPTLAKQNISGGKMKTAAVTTAMRVPLGALLLIAYDQILTNTSSKKKT